MSSTPLVTYVRCKFCRAENTIIGPVAFATYQYPNWRIDEASFYNPNGDHFCPDHSYKEWILFCQDIDCWFCIAQQNWDDPRITRTLPFEMTAEQVYLSLGSSGWHCPDGNPFGGVQDALTGSTVYP